jgi:hypothetical protein
LADGYWKDGVFTRFSEVDLKAIEQAFVERVLAQLHTRELITDDDVARILSQAHTGFGVWFGDPFHDKESEQFVARYIERAPLSLEKLSIQEDIVTYTTKDGAAHEFDALQFLALLSAQVPKPYESLTRYFGRYSCRRRGERAKKLSPPLAEEKEQESHYRHEFRKSSWAACIKRIYEINPLECPHCKAQMRIIALIQDEHSIKDIMKSQGLGLSLRRELSRTLGRTASRTFKLRLQSQNSSTPHLSAVARSAKEERLSMNSPATTLLSHLW